MDCVVWLFVVNGVINCVWVCYVVCGLDGIDCYVVFLGGCNFVCWGWIYFWSLDLDKWILVLVKVDFWLGFVVNILVIEKSVCYCRFFCEIDWVGIVYFRF